MKKKILAVSLSVLLLMSMAVGCANTPGQTADTTTDPTNADNPPASGDVTTVESNDADLLGFPKEDNGNKKFVIYTNSTKSDGSALGDFNVESQTGDLVNDAVFKKDAKVEDYLGIDIELILENGVWSKRSAFNNKIIAAYDAGDHEFDVVNSMLVCTIPLAGRGLFVDVSDLPHTGFDKPWYIKDMVENYGIGGKFYGIISDHSLSLYKDLSVIFFNADMMEDVKPDVDLYDLVRRGEWTLDKFLEVSSDMARDLNGDDAYTAGDDIFAYFGEGVPNGTWITALDIHSFEINETGNSFTYYGLTERFSSAYDRMGVFSTSPGVRNEQGTLGARDTFANGRVAFMTNFLYTTESLRDMDDDYGILPIPKYDTNQEDYISQVGTSTSTFFVPQTQMNLDLVSKFIECEAYFGYTEVSDVYYEVALKTKYIDDPNMVDMLDIVRENATITFMMVYGANYMKNSPYERFRFSASGVAYTDIASWMASRETSFCTSLQTLLDAYAALE